MRKKIWIVILLVLLSACGEKEKTDVELAQDAIKDRDREACLLHADDAEKTFMKLTEYRL